MDQNLREIVSLEQLTGHQFDGAGGKGATLARLLQAGFPVPPGFLITAGYYRQHLNSLNINPLNHPSQIRDRIVRSNLDSALMPSLLAQHNQLEAALGRPLIYVVRSSATAEDSKDTSFAGQYDSYYDVTIDKLSQKILECWASVWSEQAYSYREAHGIDHKSIDMAVVVQEMIASEISGVTFTANPVTGNTQEIITESCWGMGSALVDGRVSPDRYRVDNESGVVQSMHIADKKVMVQAQSAAGNLIPVPADMRQRPTLGDAELAHVTSYARRLKAYFKTEQDFEWSFAHGKFYLLQSRPITAGNSSKNAAPKGKYVLFKSIYENFTEPFSPLSEDFFRRLTPIITFIQGRPYIHLNYYKLLVPLKVTESELAQLAYLNPPAQFKAKLSWPKLLLTLTLVYVNYLATSILTRRCDNMPDDFMQGFRVKADQVMRNDDLDAMEAFEILFVKPGPLEPVGNMPLWVNLIAPRYAALLGLINILLKHWIPDIEPNAASSLTVGSGGILSVDMGLGIWQLANTAKLIPQVGQIILQSDDRAALRKIREIPEAEPFLRQLSKFLEIHGHRGLKEFELSSPHWQEEPFQLFGMIRNHLDSTVSPAENKNIIEQNRREFEHEIYAQLDTKTWERPLKIRRYLLNFLIQKAKYLIRLRENSRFYHSMVFHVCRLKVLKLAEKLHQSGRLDDPSDIFFLLWHEITDLRSGVLRLEQIEDRIRSRKQDHLRWSEIKPATSIGIIRPEHSSQHAPEPPTDTTIFSGQSASPGIVEGYARVILDPAKDSKLLPGEILIAPYTDPAWTPLFLTARAAVVEVGSFLSHAGTIAREYGMPCVVDVDACTTLIQTGDRIRVNGSEGKVHIIRPVKTGGFQTRNFQPRNFQPRGTEC